MAQKRNRRRRQNPSYASDTRYIVRGVVDSTRIATTGMVGIGLLGTLGSIIKK